MALIRTPVAASSPRAAIARPYVAGSGAASSGPAGGLTPSQLASAYGYEPEGGGTGQTIGIVDAFDDPNIESDLETFDTRYGLPACTTANECFKKVGQTGSTTSLPTADTTGWSVEISLDVETAHAACPKCKILLVEANNPLLENLAEAVNEAVTLGATVVSNGYGAPETGLEATERAAYNHADVPILAAAGDDGYYGWTSVNEGFRGPEMADAPASLPTVVAVGGTTLKLTTGGARASETVWNDNGPLDDIGLPTKHIGEGIALGATGGGCSKLFAAKPWQEGVAGWAATGCGTKRLVADVSAVGDPLTGFDIYDSYKCGVECEFTRIEGGWVTLGGTSLSTPLIAGLYGLAGGGHGLADPGVTLYGREADTSSRFDVTSGGSGICGGVAPARCGKPNSEIGALVDCEGTTACDAGPGFDGPSGVGTPEGLGLFRTEAPTPLISVPASLFAGTPAEFDGRSSTDAYPGVQLTRYVWSWGDGTGSEGPNPTHVYVAPGKYTVGLTVTDELGLTSAQVTTSVTAATASPPTVVTGKASAITEKEVTLNAMVNPNGTSVTKCTFEYGTSATPYEKTAPCATLPGSSTTPVSVSAALSDLSASTTYHFRIVAENASTTKGEGADETFKTAAAPATAVTGKASAITEKGATLNATVNPNGTSVTKCTFEYGTSATPYEKVMPCATLPGSGTSPVAVSAAVSGLSAGTTYHFRVVAENASTTKGEGADETFNTVGPPTAVTAKASAITEKGATLNATVNPNGIAVTACTFEYGSAAFFAIAHTYELTAACATLPGSGTSSVTVLAAISGLSAGTSYEFRVVAENASAATKGEGADETFKTAAPPATEAPAVSAQVQPGKEAGSMSSNHSGEGVKGSSSVPDAKLASASLSESPSGAVSVKISCPADETTCAGTVTLRTLSAVPASAGHSTKVKATILTLATASFTVPGGKTKTITVHLSAKARTLLSKLHLLHVRVTIAAHDSTGAKHTTQTVVALRAPKPKHGKG